MTFKGGCIAAGLPAFALTFLTLTGQAQGPNEQAANESDGVLIQFRAEASATQRAAARARVNAVREEVVLAAVRRSDGKGDLELVRIPPGLALAAAVRQLQAERVVEFAEPNWVYQHQLTSNDPYYTGGSLWGMYGDATTPANQYGSQAGEAWAAGHVGSAAVYVGIIDEGVMAGHEDLGVNVFVNPFDPVDGVDNDGNGYVDDVRGWDFANKDNSTFDGLNDDHATHVAGTIGALGGNAIGAAGVNWNVTMIPAKFLGKNGGTTADAIKAVDYLTDLKTRHGFNIVATNNSWGGGGFSQALLDAINRGGNAGILFIAAAGNGGRDGVGDNNDSTPSYPASYVCSSSNGDCVISVAAITSTGARSSFSNYGANSVDIGAPGSAVYSTVPVRKSGLIASGYASYSGTSMATPHVTGAAALYASTHPGATAAEIKAAILSNAIPTSSLAGRTLTGGRLNISGF
jgi:subtilisin family serine protease